MRIFRSEEHVQRWCAVRDLPLGGIMTPGQCWLLAQAWYGDKLSPEWRRKTLDEAEATLAGIGLIGPFWSLRP
jgi:hypothetical protein